MGLRDRLNKMRSYFVEEDEDDFVEGPIEPSETGERTSAGSQTSPVQRPAPQRPQPAPTQRTVPLSGPRPAPQTVGTYGRRVGTNAGAQPQSTYVSPSSQPTYASSQNVFSRAANAAGQNTTISVREPRTYSDVMEMANYVKKGQSCLINFRNMQDQQARRSIDFLTGIAFAFEGDIQNIGGQIFLITPTGVTVEGTADLSMLADKNFDNFDNFNLQ